MRYASRDDRRAEASPAEEYLAEGTTSESPTDEPGACQEDPGVGQCAWCGRNGRSHTPRQLLGCRERLDARAGRLR